MIFWPSFDLEFPLIPKGKVCHTSRENVMMGLTFFIVEIDSNVAFFCRVSTREGELELRC